jgi:glycosyltransferase involved in cell wall biosynthesis
MKIMMFSINPLYPEKVTGGASKHLFHIALHLGRLGHQVEIYCAKSDSSSEVFNWGEGSNVTIYPALPFSLPFPQPYAISGADLGWMTETLSIALAEADRFYIHDGEWLLPDLYNHLPTVVSFRDNIYPESVLGTFIGKPDDVICVSPYSKSVIEATVGRFFPQLRERMWLVYNGIDFNEFSPRDPSVLAQELGVQPDEELILLHPHRPERGKGLPETIRVTAELVHRHHISNLKVLIPEWIDEMVSPAESAFYQEMMQLMDELAVRDRFRFFPWLSNARMPELYSLGDVTLSLGNIVEAFGNVAYESLACHTPSLVSRVGVHRTLLPEDLIYKVPFGDVSAAAEQVLAIHKGQTLPWDEVDAFLRKTMDFDRQVNAYAEIIVNSEKRARLEFSRAKMTEDQAFCLAPWCYLQGERLYHDFRGTFEPASDLHGLLGRGTQITQKDALDRGISPDRWQVWLENTWLVPVW